MLRLRWVLRMATGSHGEAMGCNVKATHELWGAMGKRWGSYGERWGGYPKATGRYAEATGQLWEAMREL